MPERKRPDVITSDLLDRPGESIHQTEEPIGVGERVGPGRKERATGDVGPGVGIKGLIYVGIWTGHIDGSLQPVTTDPVQDGLALNLADRQRWGCGRVGKLSPTGSINSRNDSGSFRLI